MSLEQKVAQLERENQALFHFVSRLQQQLTGLRNAYVTHTHAGRNQ